MNLYELYRSGIFTKLMFIVLALLIAVLVITKLIFVAALIALSIAVSVLMGTAKLKVIGIEFVTFTVVLAGMAYDPMMAAAIGLILISFHLAMTQTFGPYITWVIPEYFFAGILTGIFKGSVALVGLEILVFINTVSILFTALTFRRNLPIFFVYAVTNIAFNMLLFLSIGQPMLSWMK